MLYDNAQLLSLYAEAYKSDPQPIYKQVVSETIHFIKRELSSPEAGFYSALDADSEGEEGKFYVWQKPELERILTSDFALFSDYYNINAIGFWEHNTYILMRTEDDSSFAARHSISIGELEVRVLYWKRLLLEIRSKRIRPGLDDKILCSWNAMTITGLIRSYQAFDVPEYLEMALANANFLRRKLMDKGGRLFHSYKNNHAKISGFLEDYAFVIEAFIAIFETTGEKLWLDDAQKLTEIAFADFFDSGKSIFYFTDHKQNDLISRTFEVHDNVIPASNSVMAKNLFRLSYLLGNSEYMKIARKMLETVAGNMIDYPSGYSNWSQLLLDFTESHYEIAVVGPNAFDLLHKFQNQYLPQVVFCAGTSENNLPLLKGRFVAGKTLIYICQDNSCQLTVETVEEAMKFILK